MIVNKLLLIFLFCIFLSTASQAQDFAPVGSVWYYGSSGAYPSTSIDYTKIESLKDTLIQGKICKKTTSDYHDRYEYLYTSGDTVFRLAANDQFYVLYDFGAHIGDKWTIRGYGVEENEIEAEIEVIHTNTTEINGKTLRQLYVESNSQDLSFSSLPIIETIGSKAFLFPQNYSYADIPMTSGLRCYEDDIFGYYNTNPSVACDFTSDVDQAKENAQIVVSPNPSHESIKISSPIEQNEVEVHIYTIDGQLIRQEIWGNTSNPLIIDLLEKGVFFLKLVKGKEIIQTQKIIRL